MTVVEDWLGRGHLLHVDTVSILVCRVVSAPETSSRFQTNPLPRNVRDDVPVADSSSEDVSELGQ